jgi:hypothetical protein
MVTKLAILPFISLAVLVAISIWNHRRQRTSRLERQFGPEYDRLLADCGSRRRTERELQARLRRVKALSLRELDTATKKHLMEAWQAARTRFADDPRGALVAAHRLVEETLDARGYPVRDLDQCMADISVHHAYVAGDYRLARDITARAAAVGPVSTEDLRQAMIYYRALFEDVLGARIARLELRHERAA